MEEYMAARGIYNLNKTVKSFQEASSGKKYEYDTPRKRLRDSFPFTLWPKRGYDIPGFNR
jgi:hypothetical protein